MADRSSEALKDCFNTTDWNMFKLAATCNNTTDLKEYTDAVTAYITKCTVDVMDIKTIPVWAVADRVGLQAPEGSKCCFQSRRRGRPEDS